MHVAGLKDAEVLRQTKMIAMKIGHFFQVQDDFFGCFSKQKVNGKLGTDIQDNKCSWLAVVCVQRANDKQKVAMLECYGETEPDKVARVKVEVYKTLGLPNTYADYEQESYNMIKTIVLYWFGPNPFFNKTKNCNNNNFKIFSNTSHNFSIALDKSEKNNWSFQMI
uniref:Farnesyl pyrophosphate synthase n=1 Tax=Glossina austeni TaxID=7395 RepID=A0A1A9VIV4_GLOAU